MKNECIWVVVLFLGTIRCQGPEVPKISVPKDEVKTLEKAKEQQKDRLEDLLLISLENLERHSEPNPENPKVTIITLLEPLRKILKEENKVNVCANLVSFSAQGEELKKNIKNEINRIYKNIPEDPKTPEDIVKSRKKKNADLLVDGIFNELKAIIKQQCAK